MWIGWLIDWLIDCWIDWLDVWSIYRLIDWFTPWLPVVCVRLKLWPMRRFVHCLIGPFFYCFLFAECRTLDIMDEFLVTTQRETADSNSVTEETVSTPKDIKGRHHFTIEEDLAMASGPARFSIATFLFASDCSAPSSSQLREVVERNPFGARGQRGASWELIESQLRGLNYDCTMKASSACKAADVIFLLRLRKIETVGEKILINQKIRNNGECEKIVCNQASGQAPVRRLKQPCSDQLKIILVAAFRLQTGTISIQTASNDRQFLFFDFCFSSQSCQDRLARLLRTFLSEEVRRRSICGQAINTHPEMAELLDKIVILKAEGGTCEGALSVATSNADVPASVIRQTRKVLVAPATAEVSPLKRTNGLWLLCGINSLNGSISRLIDCLIFLLVDWLIDWLIGLSIDWLIDWLIGWLIDLLSQSFLFTGHVTPEPVTTNATKISRLSEDNDSIVRLKKQEIALRREELEVQKSRLSLELVMKSH